MSACIESHGEEGVIVPNGVAHEALRAGRGSFDTLQ